MLSIDLPQESENLIETAARIFYTDQADLVTVNFYWIMFLTFLIVASE